MMLIKCPECELQVSDKAIDCPHCGYPLQTKISRPYKRTKRRRLPNGFGQITEIKGQNLRKPFRAMITVGKTPEGRPICKLLKPESYFETYNDAYAALVEYNRSPYSLDPGLTMQQLYERWSAEYFEKLAPSTIRNIENAWAYGSSLYDIEVKMLRPRHIKYVIDHGEAVFRDQTHQITNMMGVRFKSVCATMLDYAVEYELVEKNVAREFTVKTEASRSGAHISFTHDELDKLWQNITIPGVDMIVFECYSGWRPQELCSLELANIDLENWTMTGGMKTSNGINRIVPIHPCLRALAKKIYRMSKVRGNKYLFGDDMTYNKYYARFNRIIKILNMNPHSPHDCRKTFITLAKEYNVDEYAIKRMVGHAISDLTERVYTDRNITWLSDELGKIECTNGV